ncbi:gypsy retrotransposon integrase 1-like protein [Labeo rohita]|uniref:Gypsy retrotransposon integrase 1-like protein n=1 Tax=Labeo rohita TaxID=84645 RepID=A0A498LE82_LABRO|nr:gypsy retrotransposon integrase 1-like protein [Labeo rohita]
MRIQEDQSGSAFFVMSPDCKNSSDVARSNAKSRQMYRKKLNEQRRQQVAQCPQCQARRASIKEKKAYTPITVTEPLELVGMDLIGKLTPTESGYQYICVMVDYFTKWPEAYPLKSKSAADVTECIIDFFYKFGALKRLLTDQGREFVNKVNYSVCEKLGIMRSLCSPYHPQTNGLVEKLNGTIQRSLTKMVGEKPSSWDQHLKATLFALRTKKQITTKYSPYYLMFGREARYPCEVPSDYEVSHEKVEAMVEKEAFSDGSIQHKKCMKSVQINIQKSQDKLRKRKMERGHDDSFVVGDKVLVRNKRQECRKGGEMDKDMLGPFSIVNTDGKNVDVASEKGKVIKFNMDHLKKYVEPEPHIPKKWVSSPSHAPPSPTQGITPSRQSNSPTTPMCSKYLPIQCSATTEDKPLQTSANTTQASNTEEQVYGVTFTYAIVLTDATRKHNQPMADTRASLDARGEICIVPVELALCIQEMIKLKYFTLEYLNKKIVTFPYQHADKSDKPHPIPKNFAGKKTIGGNGHENLTLLRLLPLMDGNMVPEEDGFWNVLMDLKEVVEVVLSPKFDEDSIQYLQTKIQDHRHILQEVFPEFRLLPKHHYLEHYPDLIRCFGPLVHLWTMRFEDDGSTPEIHAACLHCHRNIAVKVTLTGRTESVDDLIAILLEKVKPRLDFEFTLQYEDADFNGQLSCLIDIQELPEKGTLKVVRSESDASSLASSDTEILPHVPVSERRKTWPDIFPVPTFSYEVEHVLEEGNIAYDRSGKTLKLSRAQKHNILESMASVIHGFKPYPSDRDVGMAAEALVKAHPCLKEPGSENGWYGWKISLKFKMGNYRTKLARSGCLEVSVNTGKRSKNNPDKDPPHSNIKRARRAEVNFLPNFPKGQNQASLEEMRLNILHEVEKIEKMGRGDVLPTVPINMQTEGGVQSLSRDRGHTTSYQLP